MAMGGLPPNFDFRTALRARLEAFIEDAVELHERAQSEAMSHVADGPVPNSVSLTPKGKVVTPRTPSWNVPVEQDPNLAKITTPRMPANSALTPWSSLRKVADRKVEVPGQQASKPPQFGRTEPPAGPQPAADPKGQDKNLDATAPKDGADVRSRTPPPKTSRSKSDFSTYSTNDSSSDGRKAADTTLIMSPTPAKEAELRSDASTEGSLQGQVVPVSILAKLNRVKSDQFGSEDIELYNKFSMFIKRTPKDFGTPLATEVASLCDFLKFMFVSSKQRQPDPDLPISAVNDLGKLSMMGNIFFFCGGMYTYRSPLAQRIYNTIFVGSFVVCTATCIINFVTVQAPPFYDVGTDLLTIYFMIVGLHSWLFWTGFLRQHHVRKFVRGFFETASKEQFAKLKHNARVVFGGLVLLQCVLMVLGLLAFPLPPLRHVQAQSSLTTAPAAGGFEYLYAWVHSSAMWAVIPQHIPTMMACIALFLLFADLHMKDMDRSVLFVEEVLDANGSIKANDGSVLGDLLYSLVDCTQERVNYNARRMQFLWIHQLAYALLQIFMSMAHLRAFATEKGELTADVFFRLCTDLFHGSFGFAAMMMILVAPADVTRRYREATIDIVSSLRGRADLCYVDRVVPLLLLKTQGFRIMGEAVSTATVAKFVTMAGLLLSAYMTLVG